MSDETTLRECPFCGGESFVRIDTYFVANQARYRVGCDVDSRCHGYFGYSKYYTTESEAIAAWNTRAYLNPDGLPAGLTISDDGTLLDWRGENYVRQGCGTLTAEQVREAIMSADRWEKPMGNTGLTNTHLIIRDDGWLAIADELNAELGSGKAKDLLLRTFGLAQMMHDCWIEECKAGDNVDISACNAYSYEFDQVAQAMFDMGIDPNGSDYYRSAELESGTCELDYDRHCSNCGVYVHESAVLVRKKLDGGMWTVVSKPASFCPNCGARIRKAVER